MKRLIVSFYLFLCVVCTLTIVGLITGVIEPLQPVRLDL